MKWVDLPDSRLKVSIHGPARGLMYAVPVYSSFHWYFGDTSVVLGYFEIKKEYFILMLKESGSKKPKSLKVTESDNIQTQ